MASKRVLRSKGNRPPKLCFLCPHPGNLRSPMIIVSKEVKWLWSRLNFFVIYIFASFFGLDHAPQSVTFLSFWTYKKRRINLFSPSFLSTKNVYVQGAPEMNCSTFVSKPVITSLLYGSPNVVNWYSPYLFSCTPISLLTRTAIINKIKPINFRPTVKQTPTKFYKKLSESSIIFTVATCDQERLDSAQPRSNVWTFFM